MEFSTPTEQKTAKIKQVNSEPKSNIPSMSFRKEEIDSLIKNFRTPIKSVKPRLGSSVKNVKYLWKNKFQDEFRRGDFEAADEDLKNLELESWVPIYKYDVEKYQKQKNKEKEQIDPLLRYVNPSTVKEIEKRASKMITHTYREMMTDAIPNLLKNQEILAQKVAEKQKISDAQILQDKAAKERMIQTILLLQDDLEQTRKYNQRLANNISLLKKAQTQAQLSRNGLKAQINSGLI